MLWIHGFSLMSVPKREDGLSHPMPSPSTSWWVLRRVERREQDQEVTGASGWNRAPRILVFSELSPTWCEDAHTFPISQPHLNKKQPQSDLRSHPQAHAHIRTPTFKSEPLLTVTCCHSSRQRKAETPENGHAHTDKTLSGEVTLLSFDRA